MPFVTIDEISKHVSESEADAVIAAGHGKESTAFEAAQCISHYVAAGDGRMHQANDEFNRLYGRGGRLSAEAVTGRSIGASK